MEQLRDQGDVYSQGWLSSVYKRTPGGYSLRILRQDVSYAREIFALEGASKTQTHRGNIFYYFDYPEMETARKAGKVIRQLKADKVPQEEIDEAVDSLVTLKNEMNEKYGNEPDPITSILVQEWTEEKTRAFIRGVFDANGSVSNPERRAELSCSLVTSNLGLFLFLKAYLNGVALGSAPLVFLEGIKVLNQKEELYRLSFRGTNALDFLSRIYDEADRSLPRKNAVYLRWANLMTPASRFAVTPHLRVKFAKTLPDAVTPSKSRASDIGWDVTVIKKLKTVGNVTYFDTGIAVSPPPGWYVQTVPRSGLSKTGWMLANSMGIIDPAYRGNLIFALRWLGNSEPKLDLPYRVGQMVLLPAPHWTLEEAETLEDLGVTERQAKGYGSSGAK